MFLCRSKIQHQEALSEQVQRERVENSELKGKICRLEDELSGYAGNEQRLTDQLVKLRGQAELGAEEARLARGQLGGLQDGHAHIVAGQRAAFLEEKTQLELRVRELHDRFENASSKLCRAALIHKKVNTVTACRFRHPADNS